MTPPSSAHVQLDDAPRTLDPAEARGRVSSARRRGDGDCEEQSLQGFANHNGNYDGG